MKIDVLPLAAQHRDELLDFIAEQHSFEISNQVYLAIEACIQGLPLFPKKWPAWYSPKFGEVRRALVKSRTVIFYRIVDNRIQVLDIFDARSNWQ